MRRLRHHRRAPHPGDRHHLYAPGGYSPEKIAEQYDSLDLVQIYAALTYYYENRVELDKEMQEYDTYFERMDEKWREYVERHGGHPPDKPAPEDRHIAKPADWKPKR